jgi:hypothetical protein
LPEAYRLPLILCCLEGHTQEEAARQLRLTPGAVKGRLERGRAKLHTRLTRRGLTLSASLLALELSQGVGKAGVPLTLRASSVRAALTVGLQGAKGGASAYAMTLAEGVFKSMAMTKLKIGAFLLVAGIVLAAGGVGVYNGIRTGNSSADAPGLADQRATDTDRPGPQPSANTQKAVEMLKANLDNFGLFVTFSSDGKEPYGTIELATHCSEKSKTPPHWLGCADLGKEGAEKVIDHLAACGYFDRATAIAMSDQDARVRFYSSENQPYYSLQAAAAYKDPQYHEILGWDLKMLQRLDALRKVLDGDAAELMDKLLRALEPQRKKWAKPEKQGRTSDWGEDSKGLQCRVEAPTEIEKGMPLEVGVEFHNDPKKLEPGVRRLNAYGYNDPAFVELVLTNRTTEKQLNVRPYDPSRGMDPGDDRGGNAIPLDGTAPKPWRISFPMAQLGDNLAPGSYDCRVQYSWPATPHRSWRGTDTQWAQFWHGTVRSGSFRLEVLKETPRTQTLRLPKSLRVEPGLKVGHRNEDTENVTVPVRNGYIVGVRLYREGVEYQLMSGPPIPDVVDVWSEYKKGDKKVTYTIEIFETADRPEHMWHPGPGSGGYKVLWKKTFTLALTEEEIRKLLLK